VRFSVPGEGRVRADIFDAAGRRIRSLYRGMLPAGFQSLSWDGLDEAGRPARPGIYFMIVESGQHREHIKLTLIR
jgi:flagellar hook assembly protein FlgD